MYITVGPKCELPKCMMWYEVIFQLPTYIYELNKKLLQLDKELL